MSTVSFIPVRPTGFLARVDKQLGALGSDAERLDFLDKQLDGWTRRYAVFICTEGRSEPGVERDDPPHATDFLLTISGLSARRESIAETMPVRALCELLTGAAR